MTWFYSIEGGLKVFPSLPSKSYECQPSKISLRRKSIVDANVVYYESTSNEKILPEIGDPACEKKVDLLALASISPKIQAISFVPTNPLKFQTLFVRRIPNQDLSEGIDSFFSKMIHTTWLRFREGFVRPFNDFPRFDQSPLGYVVEPSPYDEKILDYEKLSNNDPQIKKVLDKFLEDTESENIAISVLDDRGKENLYVWSKEGYYPPLPNPISL